MSEAPLDPLDSLDPPPANSGRAASVTFQSAADARSAASMDPAQRSLAEALRITFFLLQIGMVVLIVLFLVSGARQVREAERGVKLFLGRVVDQDVQPGLRFAWPFPLGEFVTVETGQVTMSLNDSFYPRLSEGQKKQPLDELRMLTRMGLKPGQDGSLITGDGNIVHAKWTIVYRREDPALFIKNLYPSDEQALVRSAVERGVVRTIAELPIDNLLKQAAAATPESAEAAPTEGIDTPPEGEPAEPAPESVPGAAPESPAPQPSPGAAVAAAESSIAARVREIAQDTLDAIGAGIVIEKVVMEEPTPPLPVRPNFNKVQSSQSTAEKERENAEQQRRERLNSVAGEAHTLILERIDAYERAIELGDEPGSEAILLQIDALLEGETVEIDGRTVEPLVSGEAANIINQARQYRTEIVSSSRTSVETFRAKLEQYRANPAVLLNREWTDAYNTFLNLPTVQTMVLPRDTALELWLNADPDIAKAIEAVRNRTQIEATLQQREAEFQRQQKQRTTGSSQ